MPTVNFNVLQDLCYLTRPFFPFPVRKKITPPDIRSTREVESMKKYDAPVVQCEYAKAEKSLSHLLEETFRLYLARILAVGKPSAVSCGR